MNLLLNNGYSDLVCKISTPLSPEQMADVCLVMFEVLTGADWRVFRHLLLKGLGRADRRFGYAFQEAIFATSGSFLLES